MDLRKLLAGLVILTSTSLLASPNQVINCYGDEHSYVLFHAKLFSYPYERDRFSKIKDASMTDNYAHASLSCTGNSFDGTGIACVGFWFSMREYVAHVTIAKNQRGNIEAKYKTFGSEGGPFDIKGGPIKCHLSKLVEE